MSRAWIGLFVVVMTSCSQGSDGVQPGSVSQRGGEILHVHTSEPCNPGSMIVLVDGVPAHSLVVEAPRLLRVSLPSLPRAGRVEVELVSADQSVEVVAELEVTAPVLDVRVRE